jgi:phosphatidylserine/phosphatidylglycerophosphate/cardiolipin synthase-like enzyme
MGRDNTELLTGLMLYRRVIQEAVLQAERTVWIATANLKDMHIQRRRGFRPILEAFDQMAADGVTMRIIHSELPSLPFRETLERFPRLTQGALELQICPRSHWKMAIVDGRCAYMGSANFTGAGLGVKGEGRRNLELGIFTTDPEWVRTIESLFDSFWIGRFCEDCAFSQKCPDPILSE